MVEKTDLKKLNLKYGGKCAQCNEWVKRGEEAWYGDGKVYHLGCVDVAQAEPGLDDAVNEILDRLADLADRCHRIEDKLVSLCVPVPEKQPKVEDLMGAKK